VTSDSDVKGEDVVQQTLAGLRSIHGLITASLVEPDSAHVLETVAAGQSLDDATPNSGSATARTVASGASDVIQVIGLMAANLGEPDELEDVIITLGRRHHLISPLPAAGSDGLIMVVTLDRERTNLALARQQLRALGPLWETATTPSRVS
jgi:hypothetical protein